MLAQTTSTKLKHLLHQSLFVSSEIISILYVKLQNQSETLIYLSMINLMVNYIVCMCFANHFAYKQDIIYICIVVLVPYMNTLHWKYCKWMTQVTYNNFYTDQIHHNNAFILISNIMTKTTIMTIIHPQTYCIVPEVDHIEWIISDA